MGSSNINLKITGPDGKTDSIDASPLGQNRFNAMFAEMESCNPQRQVQEIPVTKK